MKNRKREWIARHKLGTVWEYALPGAILREHIRTIWKGDDSKKWHAGSAVGSFDTAAEAAKACLSDITRID